RPAAVVLGLLLALGGVAVAGDRRVGGAGRVGADGRDGGGGLGGVVVVTAARTEQAQRARGRHEGGGGEVTAASPPLVDRRVHAPESAHRTSSFPSVSRHVVLVPGRRCRHHAHRPSSSLPKAASTRRPHAGTSPSRHAPTASSSDPAGHGSAAIDRGLSRTLRADNPVPATACHAATVATGDVSTAATAHGSTPGYGCTVRTGTLGTRSPSSSTTHSITDV